MGASPQAAPAYIGRKRGRQRLNAAALGLPFVEPCRKKPAPFAVAARSVMTDFATLRRHMVDGQVRPADITDIRITTAMLEIPRERFVPTQMQSLAYLDRDLGLSAAGSATRTLMKPMVLSKLNQALE